MAVDLKGLPYSMERNNFLARYTNLYKVATCDADDRHIPLLDIQDYHSLIYNTDALGSEFGKLKEVLHNTAGEFVFQKRTDKDIAIQIDTKKDGHIKVQFYASMDGVGWDQPTATYTGGTPTGKEIDARSAAQCDIFLFEAKECPVNLYVKIVITSTVSNSVYSIKLIGA